MSKEEHVSVPRELIEALVKQWKQECMAFADMPAGIPVPKRLYLWNRVADLEDILSRATPSDDDFYCCNGVDCGCQGITKREYAEACSKNPSAPRVVKEPLSVFSGGMWTWNETGQSFTKEEMDEAAFIAYRDHAESFATSLPAEKK